MKCDGKTIVVFYLANKNFAKEKSFENKDFEMWNC